MGARPVLCDVEAEAATMDPESLAKAVNTRTRAIVPVHLYGQCADMEAILEVGDRRGVPVVEDCAQAHGAMFRDRHAGTMGTMGCFSFYPTKNLGALGDAGAVVTSDERLAERIRLLRQYGQSDRYHHVTAGVNSRADELQAAILRKKLLYLDGWNRRRAEIATAYSWALRKSTLKSLEVRREGRHAFHLYVVRADNRDSFQSEMERRGVATLIHYPLPIHHHDPYRALGEGPVPLYNTEQLSREVVSLPLYPELTGDEVDTVATAARESAEAAA
jgi:dTDP-4-amino-4,6-dideoxygalactose transaminase